MVTGDESVVAQQCQCRALITAIIALPAVVTTPPTAHAADRSTPRQARALFEKAVAFMESQGPEKAFTAFNDQKEGFVAGDLYVFALDLEGTVDYVWRNPVNDQVENKRSFIKRVGEYFLGVGYYSD